MSIGCDKDTSGDVTSEVYAFPLSFAQQRLWFLDQLEPASAAYNISFAFRLRGSLNLAALEESLNELLRRHESLRTTFSLSNQEPVQVVHPHVALSLPITDLRHLPAASRDETVQGFLLEHASQPFDLASGPLFRVGLVQTESDESIFCLNVHHIVSDGWSMGVLFRELSSIYKAHCAGKPVELAELPIQYADYAVWQREWLTGDTLEQQLSYWRKQLDGLTTLSLPTDRAHPAERSYRGSSQAWTLSARLTEAIKSIGQREGATLFMTLLAAFQVLLSRYSGQFDIAVGSPIAGRNRHETEGLIGFFVNTLVLRGDLSGNPRFTDLLRQVRETTLAAYSHQDLPFDKLVEELHPDRNLSISPLFQVLFVFQNTAADPLELEPILVSPIRRKSSIAKFDLSLTMSEQDRQLRGFMNYNTDIFDASTIERMVGHFQNLLEGIAANPNRPISALPLLAETEKLQLLVQWNDNAAEFPRQNCIHELFGAQVEKTPDAIAVVFQDQHLTYRDLNSRANQLAHYLRRLGVGSEVPVGICMERSMDMVVGLLGILKAGGAYVPLDPDYPQERLNFIIEDTHAEVIVADSVTLDSLPSSGARVICLDRQRQEIGGERQDNPRSECNAGQLAYLCYTSGSTGVPKGVEVPHRGVARLLFGVDYVALGGARTILQLAPISFDAATFEVWGALLHGGQCILYPGRVPSPRELGEVLKRHRVDTLWLTASLYNIVIDEEPEALLEVTQLVIGGEALSVAHVKKGLMLLAKTQIVNGYGPTESTTFACCYRIPRDLDAGAASVPIGKPIGNTQVYILDGDLNPVPIGVPGELHIGGDGLARGYLNQPELTVEKFIANPFSTDASSRLYRTGDLARYLPDGNIDFLGRIDGQVKIRGYRIELGEIESVLAQHSGVRTALVVAREDHPGDKRLVGYVISNQPDILSQSELQRYLKEKVPEYMVPYAIMFLENFPLTANGKIDRKKLPIPEQSQSEGGASSLAPRTATEETLAQVWAEVLKVKKVGIHDNFFDLGGHSLLGIKVISQLRRKFGEDLPVRTLFEAPTIAQLASRLEHPSKPMVSLNGKPSYSHLIELRGGPNQKPIFCFPYRCGVQGEYTHFLRLAKYMVEYSFYGLQAKAADNNTPPDASVEELVTNYIREIEARDPTGPYYLIGDCAGAPEAYETARQLSTRGKSVGLLVLLDARGPYLPGSYRRLGRYSIKDLDRFRNRLVDSRFGMWCRYVAGAASSHWQASKQLPLGERWGYVGRKVFGGLKTQLAASRMFIPEPFEEAEAVLNASEQELLQHIYRVRSQYRRNWHSDYGGRLAVIVNAQWYGFDRTYGWAGMAAGGVETYSIPGDHISYMLENVPLVADQLRACLKKAVNPTGAFS